MSYYLKSNITKKEDKIKYDCFKLYNDQECVKKFNNEESTTILKIMKKMKVEPDIKNKSAYINDERFILHILTSNLKRRKVNKKLMAIITLAGLLAISGTSKISNSKNKSKKEFEEIYQVIDVDHLHGKEKTTENYKEEPIKILEDEVLTIEEPEITVTAKPEIKPEILAIDTVDNSNDDEINYVRNNYKYLTDVTSANYGIDSQLMDAIIAVENPYNNANQNFVGGHGVTQLEHINHNENYETFNFTTNELDYTGNIDIYRADYDVDYAIRIASIIFSKQYNYLNDRYSNKFSDSDILKASIFAYNKGISIIDKAMANTNNFDDFKYYVITNSVGGNNNYIEEVLSKIPDETVLKMRTDDKKEHNILIDNLNVKNSKSL